MEKETAYCIKCKAKQEMIEVVDSTFKNGTPVRKGKCPICGNALFRIVKRKVSGNTEIISE